MPMPPRVITARGETRTLNEWAKLTGIPAETIRSRIDHQGYAVEDAVTVPSRAKFDPRKPPTTSAPRRCPNMRPHTSGQARVVWQARGREQVRYLGKWGSKEAAEAYKRFQIEWATCGADDGVPSGAKLEVGDLVERYLEHVDRYYVKEGKRTSEVYGQRAAMSVLNELYGPTPANEFKARHLKACQTEMVAKRGWVRGTVNQNTWRIVRCFQWGVAEDLVHPDVYARIAQVPNLQPGRSDAADTEPILSVPEADITATLPFLHADPRRRAVLVAMIRFQLQTGCRPGELCRMTVDAIDRSGRVWCYAIGSHKNLHRQARRKPRLVWIGPRAQEILAPFLADPGPGGRVWSFPPRGEKGAVRTAVSRMSYGEFVRLACERAKVEPWTPHQLRHNRATEVQRIYESNEHAARAIGDTPEVTANVYVDPNEAIARRIAEATG